MNHHHVVTPFSRWLNLPALKAMMAQQKVEWHLLLDDWMPRVSFDEPWIHVSYHRAAPPGFFVGHWLYNMFLDDTNIVDSHHYNLITDDDFFEPGMFDKIRKVDSDIIITSMNRGRIDVLPAAPGNMSIGRVGLEQLHARGSIMKQYRLNGFYESDGFLLEALWREQADKFTFVPEAQVYFNYLPPGKAGTWG